MRSIVITILATIILLNLARSCFVDIYRIQGASMTGTLLNGDRVLVSKISYGFRVPGSFKMPFVNHNSGLLKYFDIKLYTDVLFPYKRMGGISKIRRTDLVVFNSPVPYSNYEINQVFDKRVVALPGDTILIAKDSVCVNGQLQNNDFAIFGYKIKTRKPITRLIAIEWGILDYSGQVSEITSPLTKGLFEYIIYINKIQEKKIKQSQSVISIEERRLDSFSDQRVFPYWLPFGWNKDNYGPIIVPRHNLSIIMDSVNLHKYYYLIKYYEGHKNVEINNEKLIIDSEEINEYRFKHDYYFVMGDNRDNSVDSRHLGFIPESHIIGKVVFIPFSSDVEESKVRWNRVFVTPN